MGPQTSRSATASQEVGTDMMRTIIASTSLLLVRRLLLLRS